MKPTPKPLPGNPTQVDEQLAALVRQLAEVETAIQTLTGGQVDSIMSPEGHTFMLRQTQEALSTSEERFRQIAENIREVFWMTNTDKNEMLYISPGYEKIWGRTCQSLYEQPTTWLDAIHTEDRERVLKAALEMQIKGKYDEEYRIVQPGGSVRWIWDRAFPIMDTLGRVYRIAGIAEDITDRKRAEEELRSAKDFSENLIQTASVIIVGLDLDGNINIFNQMAEKITGYTLSELKGKNWFDILTPKDRYHYVWDEFARLVAGGIPKTFENPILTKTGEERYVMWENNQVKINGKIAATISFGNDITERKQVERRRSAQRAVTQILAVSATLGQATPMIIQQICESLQWKVGYLWIVDKHVNLLRRIDGWHIPEFSIAEFEAVSLKITFPLGVGLPGRVWASREPAWIPDVVKDTNFPRAPAAAREGLHSACAFPIWSEDEIIGILEFFSDEIRPLDDDLLQMMANIGSQIGQFTNRKQAEEKRRQRIEELERFNRLAVGRELRMVELKVQINDLSQQLGKAPPYHHSNIQKSET